MKEGFFLFRGNGCCEREGCCVREASERGGAVEEREKKEEGREEEREERRRSRRGRGNDAESRAACGVARRCGSLLPINANPSQLAAPILASNPLLQLGEATNSRPSSEEKDKHEGARAEASSFLFRIEKTKERKKQACSLSPLAAHRHEERRKTPRSTKPLRHLFPRLCSRLKSAPGQALDKHRAFPLCGFGRSGAEERKIGARKEGRFF